MDTRELLWRIATGNPNEREQAFDALTAEGDHYPALLRILAEAKEVEDSRVIFWCLELLMQHYLVQLQGDSAGAIPLLLNCLTLDNGPVIDRASRALNCLGQPAVEALLAAIGAAPDNTRAAHYAGALRRNSNVYLAEEQVLGLLGKQLGSSNDEVRYWAMVVLLDISPLRPWFDSRMQLELFEPLYKKLLTVAHAFAISSGDEMTSRYEELLRQHLQ